MAYNAHISTTTESNSRPFDKLECFDKIGR